MKIIQIKGVKKREKNARLYYIFNKVLLLKTWVFFLKNRGAKQDIIKLETVESGFERRWEVKDYYKVT